MTMPASDEWPSQPKSWHQFLQSPAISYPASNSKSVSIQSSSPSQRSHCSREYYWHPQLLERWKAIGSGIGDIDITGRRVQHDDGDGSWFGKTETGTESINYASYILMATYLGEKLRHLLSLSPVEFTTYSHDHLQHDCSSSNIMEEDENCKDTNRGLQKVGIAIPEGPFLPLYVLAVHALNVAVGENWLDLVDDSDFDNHASNEATKRRCQGVVIIPMETDEAPERLKHMLADSQPDLILVALGNDWARMNAAVQNIIMKTTTTAASSSPSTQSCTQLVDFVQLMEDAWNSICLHVEQNHLDDASLILEQLWPPEIRNDALDSLRYSHSIHGCFDVARLVALGVVHLSSLSSPPPLPSSSLLSPPPRNCTPRQLISHIVYTSGTTGKPKGCVSSLASLQNYIRAKNLAHSIDNRSRVLLASAISFDPCFSDVLAVCVGNATLCVVTREQLYSREDIEYENENADCCCRNDEHGRYRGLTQLMRQLEISHVLCTPTLWATVEGTPPNNIPSLQIVALGGEPIPKTMIKKWARRRSVQDRKWDRDYPRLCSTYGVTEACVYQTFGEVASDDSGKNTAPFCDNEDGGTKVPKTSLGQCVGLPFFGTNIHICYPHPEDECLDQFMNSPVLKHVEQAALSSEPAIGEVVLSGSQVDVKSSYLNLDVTSRVFIQCRDVGTSFGHDSYFYRTGDLGYIDRVSGNLHILGRIQGDNMVKINGVRVELSEVEHAVIDEELDDDEEGRLIIDCIAALVVCSSMSSDIDEHERKQLVAYCLLSAASISQFGISSDQLKTGVVVPPGPLMSVLRARCNRQVRKGCTPSFFVLIDRIPLSPTGKRSRSTLPNLANCSIVNALMNGKESSSLWESGAAGSIVADAICECLNLQPCQQPLVTLNANFFALGGDSLAATRVVRRLYAIHHGILDSRNLGGPTGTLSGIFSPKYLLQSNTLGDFVEHLVSNSIFQTAEFAGTVQNVNEAEKNDDDIDDSTDSGHSELESVADPLHASLIEAITLGYTSIASALLDLGVDPNSQSNQARLGKVTDRKQQRLLFNSNPLHLACLRGDPYLVKKLLQSGCKANRPDASGSFPIHLACSRIEGTVDSDEEDLNRLLCVKHLLDTGKIPLTIKDGNRQTILHSAARSGHIQLLRYLIDQWRETTQTLGIYFKSHNNIPGRLFDWQDRWYRTPVHWAVLNQRTEALQILLDGGCSAFPSKPKRGVSSRATNVLIETPLEMCLRLYGDSAGVGAEISSLLRNAEY